MPNRTPHDEMSEQLREKIERVVRDIDKINIVVDRLNVTLDKLGDISSNVAMIMTEQSTKLKNQEQVSDRLIISFDKYKEDINSSLQRIRDDLKIEIKSIKAEINKEYVKNNEFTPIKKGIYAVLSLIASAIVGLLTTFFGK